MLMQLSFKHDQQVAVGGAAVVERLEGHAGGHRAVADHGHGMAVQFTFQLAGHGHAERAANGLVLLWPTPNVSYSLSLRFGKPLNPPCRVRLVWKVLSPTGEDLVPVCLMSLRPIPIGRMAC
jgi:hypothetical protein